MCIDTHYTCYAGITTTILFSSVFRICIRILAQDKVNVSLKSYIIMLIKVDDDLTPLLINKAVQCRVK